MWGTSSRFWSALHCPANYRADILTHAMTCTDLALFQCFCLPWKTYRLCRCLWKDLRLR